MLASGVLRLAAAAVVLCSRQNRPPPTLLFYPSQPLPQPGLVICYYVVR